MEALYGIAEALEGSSLGTWARGSSFAYPLANLAHLLGLVMLVGSIGIVDLRLAGFWRELPLAQLSRALTPVGIGGLLLMAPSGLVLFAADAGPLIRSSAFQLKVLLIALAIANALAFRTLSRDRLAGWQGSVPLPGRLMAIGSIGAWLMIAALGRLIAYT